MQSYLPFDADSGGLYEEHVRVRDAPPSYETDALKHVLQKLRASETRLIVLTGDAGHGKTHLCRRIVEIGIEEGDGEQPSSAHSALRHLTSDPEGRTPIHLPGVGGHIRVVKDLSEFDEEKGAEILAEVLEEPTEVGLVCANEGRLRAVISHAPFRLEAVSDALESGIRDGRTTIDGSVHVINLNYQACATASGFIFHLLKNWVGDQRRWRGCDSCSAAPDCPIRANGRRLALDESTRDGFMQLVRSAEQSGYVLTYREALILVSLLVTGGGRCEDVARLHSAGGSRGDRLQGLALDTLLFEAELTEAQREQLPILGRLRRRDPGTAAFRTVDESVLTVLEEQAASGPLISFAAQTNRQRKQEARRYRELLRRGRRRKYFQLEGSDAPRERTAFLRLDSYQDFDHVQSDDEDPRKMKYVVERVVRGLHVIQGIRVADRSALYLADPAFTRSGVGTSVIAATIPRTQLWLFGLKEYWVAAAQDWDVDLPESVDWLDREVVLCRGRDNPTEVLRLDLLQFEYVLRAAKGSAFSNFHAADRRRILAKLGRFAEADAQLTDQIKFASGQTLRRLIVEQDGAIEVHDG